MKNLIFFVCFSLIGFVASGAQKPAAKYAATSTLLDTEKEESQTFSANIGLISDYLFRGLTLSDHKPAAQAGIDWVHGSGMRLGFWASSMHVREKTIEVYNEETEEDETVLLEKAHLGAELDFSAGYTYEITDELSLDFGGVVYAYVGGKNANWEIPLQIEWKGWKIGGSYTHDWDEGSGAAWYLSAGYSRDVYRGLVLGVHAGHSFLPREAGARDYFDFKASAARRIFDVEWEIAAVFVDRRQFEGADDPRFVLTAVKSF